MRGRVLLGIVGLQVVGLLAVVGLVVVSAQRPAVAALDVAVLLGAAVVLALLGRSVARGGRSGRGALVVLEALVLAVASYMVRGGLVALGLVVGASGLAGAAAVLALASDDDPS